MNCLRLGEAYVSRGSCRGRRPKLPMSGRCPVYLCPRLHVANIGHARQTSLMSLLPEHAKAESGRNDSKIFFYIQGAQIMQV